MDKKNANSLRVLLADNFLLVRAGMRMLLDSAGEAEVVAEAADGREAVRLMRTQRPAVAIVKAMLPELNGIEVTAQANRQGLKTRVLLIDAVGDEPHVFQGLRAGAAGFLTYACSVDELHQAIREAATGKTYLSPTVSRQVTSAFLESGIAALSSLDRLTARQREILQLVAEGNTSKEIARKLSLSPKTVEGHRTQLMKSLDCRDVTGLVRYAIQMGLIPTAL